MGKHETRAAIRTGRRTRSDDDRSRAAAALLPRTLALVPQRSSVIACYLSLPQEPGTAELVSALRAIGHTVVVPRIDGEDLQWIPLDDDTTTVVGPMGIREPVGGNELASLAWVDVVVLPALAVDADGRRLGQGGGFYDRALAGVPPHADGGPLRIALLFDDEILDDVHAEAHDVAVDIAVTPDRVVDFRTPAQA